MICPNCHKEFEGKFCPYCGHAAAESGAAQTAPAEADQPAEEVTAQVAEEQPAEEVTAQVAEEQPAEEAPMQVAEEQPAEEVTAQVAEDQPAEEETAQVAEDQPAEEAPVQAAVGAQGENKTCSKCGKMFSGKFCPYCGAKAEDAEVCPICGTPHESGMKFCIKCGHAYGSAAAPAAAEICPVCGAPRENGMKFCVKCGYSYTGAQSRVPYAAGGYAGAQSGMAAPYGGSSGGAQTAGETTFADSAKSFMRRNGKKVIATAVLVAILVAIIVPVAVIFTSPTAAANVDRINIGDSKERVLDILGEPYDYDPSDTVFTYYSSSYEKILKKLDSGSDFDNFEDFEDLGNAWEEEMELEQKLEEMDYKETKVYFDEHGKVTSLRFDANAQDEEDNTKRLKSSQVTVDEIVGYEMVEVPYTLKYTDGSIYKGTQSVMAEMMSGYADLKAYNPFGESVNLSVSVAPNSNVETGDSGGVEYIVYPNGEATISGTGIITKELVNRIDTSIVTLTIEEGITGIEAEAFADCGSITEVSIPSTITSVGKNAFGSSVSYNVRYGVKYLGNEDNPYHAAMGPSNTSYQININSNTKVIADYAFYQSNLTSITMPAGSVEYIGAYAFAESSNLRRVDMENDVKSLGDYAFYKCSSLQSVSMQGGATSIGEYAFYNCTSLTSISIPYGVTSIGQYAFYNCESLASISIPESVTSIGQYAFSNCSSLTSVTIGDSVTSIGQYAFNNCSSLTSVTIGDSVTSIGERAFYNCTSLTEVHISDIAAWCAIEFGDVYANPLYYAENLYLNGNLVTELVIPNGVTNIGGYAFYNCTSLTSITIGDSVTSIGGYAFYNCASLTSITIGGSVTSVGEDAFYDCTSLTEVHISDIEAWCAIEFSNEYANPLYYAENLYLNGNLVTELVIPNGVTSIGDYAFRNCTSLTSITIPESVTSIGSYAFSSCDSLTEVHISDIEAWCAVEFGNVSANPLYYAENLYLNGNLVTELEIPAGITEIKAYSFAGFGGTSVTMGDSVTSIGSSAFYNGTSLTSITIPDSVTSIGEDAFYNCSLLVIYCEATSMPSGWNSNWNSADRPVVWDCNNTDVADDGNIYYIAENGVRYAINGGAVSVARQSQGLSGAIEIPASITYKDVVYSVTSIERSAFSGCSLLTSVTIPDSVTSISWYAFYNCDSLESITIPDSVTSIGDYAFRGCTSLTSVTIPDSVTSISWYAFYNCTSLTSVTIPDSVTSIGQYAFRNCTALTIYCEAASKPSGWNSTWNYSDCPVVWDCNNTDVADDGNIYYVAENGFRYALNGEAVSVARQSQGLSGAIEIPASITYNDVVYSVTSIKSSAFSGCTSLTSVTIPDSVTSIGSRIFAGCDSLESITVEEGNSTYHSAGNCIIETASKTLIAGCKNSVIPTDGSVTSIGDRAFYNCTSLTSITIGDSVTSIGRYAFYGCTSLTSITIPDSVTSIGRYAFYGCTSLESMTIPFVGATLNGTSNTHFGYIFGASSYSDNDDYVPSRLKSVTITGGSSIRFDAFYYCDSLTSVTIPDSVTSIGSSAFFGCSSLTEVHISDIAAWCAIEFSNEYANPLYYANNLYLDGNLVTELEIPYGVTSIGAYAFYNCDSLTSITIPDSVTSIRWYAFYNCDSLESITIPESVTSIGEYAFYNCTSLTSVTIPDSVTSISWYAFYNCTSLESITIPDSVTSIGSFAFYNCDSLTSVTIPDSVTSIRGDAFSSCDSLTEVHISDIEAWCAIEFSNEYANPLYYAGNLYLNGNLVAELEIPYGMTSIGDYAFYNCSSLTSITIPASVTSIGDYAFYNCSSLTSITIPASVTSIGSRIFAGCDSLESITVEEGNSTYHSAGNCIIETASKTLIAGCKNSVIPMDGSVTSIGEYAFSGCTSLTSITIPDSVTSIGRYAFYGCTSLESMTIPFVGAELNGTSNTHFGYIFGASSYSYNGSYVPSSLKSVTITGGSSIGQYAFRGCTALTSVTIPDSVTSIGQFAFASSGITELVIPDSVTSIGNNAFDASDLVTVTLPANLTSISDDLFYNCGSLTSITIPDSVTSIGSYAFGSCNSLESITFQGTKAQWKAISKGGYWNTNTGNYTIHCTDGDI